MRFNCGPSMEQKAKAARAVRQAYVNRISQWHQVFVLWPRRFGGSATSPGVCVWMEYIWRRVDPMCGEHWVKWGHGSDHPFELGYVEWSLEDPR